jgi:hypothetical protein
MFHLIFFTKGDSENFIVQYIISFSSIFCIYLIYKKYIFPLKIITSILILSSLFNLSIFSGFDESKLSLFDKILIELVMIISSLIHYFWLKKFEGSLKK